MCFLSCPGPRSIRKDRPMLYSSSYTHITHIQQSHTQPGACGFGEHCGVTRWAGTSQWTNQFMLSRTLSKPTGQMSNSQAEYVKLPNNRTESSQINTPKILSSACNRVYVSGILTWDSSPTNQCPQCYSKGPRLSLLPLLPVP